MSRATSKTRMTRKGRKYIVARSADGRFVRFIEEGKGHKAKKKPMKKSAT